MGRHVEARVGGRCVAPSGPSVRGPAHRRMLPRVPLPRADLVTARHISMKAWAGGRGRGRRPAAVAHRPARERPLCNRAAPDSRGIIDGNVVRLSAVTVCHDEVLLAGSVEGAEGAHHIRMAALASRLGAVGGPGPPLNRPKRCRTPERAPPATPTAGEG